jgi:hypothetical protein
MRAYDLSGRLTLGFDAQDARLARLLARRMDPFRPTDVGDRPPDVTLEPGALPRPELLDIQNAARDGTVTAFDGARLLVLEDGLACALPEPATERPLRFCCEPGFPLDRIFPRVIRPALHLALHANDAVALHSAAVELDGGAVLVAGWSESGKTETALALMESGARFLSDKWTVLGTDGEASAFPVDVGIRRWVLPYLRSLEPALEPKARARLAVAGAAAAASRPLRARRSRAAALAQRAVGLADRVALRPSRLRAAYGQHDDPARRDPLDATVLLVTVPGPAITCEEVDAAWAAARLARSAAYERRELYGLFERRRYVLPSAAGTSPADSVAVETALLERALGHGRTLAVRAPFPVDPRAVAAQIMRRLRAADSP